MSSTVRYENVDLEVTKGRWDVYLTIRHREVDVERVFVLSADSYLTEGDGIWMGSQLEYEATI